MSVVLSVVRLTFQKEKIKVVCALITFHISLKFCVSSSSSRPRPLLLHSVRPCSLDVCLAVYFIIMIEAAAAASPLHDPFNVTFCNIRLSSPALCKHHFAAASCFLRRT